MHVWIWHVRVIVLPSVNVSIKRRLLLRIEAALVDPVKARQKLAKQDAGAIYHNFGGHAHEEVQNWVGRLGQREENCVELGIESIWQVDACCEEQVLMSRSMDLELPWSRPIVVIEGDQVSHG